MSGGAVGATASFLFGLVLAVPGLILYLIGGVGPLTLAWLLLVCAAFNVSIAATCHVALRRLPPQDGG